MDVLLALPALTKEGFLPLRDATFRHETEALEPYFREAYQKLLTPAVASVTAERTGEQSRMKHNGTASPDQLSMLTKVLDEHCKRANIPHGSRDREDIAATIISLYESGISTEEVLLATLSGHLSAGR